MQYASLSSRTSAVQCVSLFFSGVNLRPSPKFCPCPVVSTEVYDLKQRGEPRASRRSNFEGSVLGRVNEKNPSTHQGSIAVYVVLCTLISSTIHRPQLFEICLFVLPHLWISIFFVIEKADKDRESKKYCMRGSMRTRCRSSPSPASGRGAAAWPWRGDRRPRTRRSSTWTFPRLLIYIALFAARADSTVSEDILSGHLPTSYPVFHSNPAM